MPATRLPRANLARFWPSPMSSRPIWGRMRPMNETPVLVVDELHVSYGPIRGLRGCSLEVRRGEAVAVVGAVGHGKTTLLRGICHMLPWTGAIHLDGVPTNNKR